MTPEQTARVEIDALLAAAGWLVQDYHTSNLAAGRGIALREVQLKSGTCDYLLMLDRQAVGVVEAKKKGTLLSGVAEQSGHYAENLPDFIKSIAPSTLPFLYESTGVEAFFRDERDPEPRSRRVFSFHRPETLAAWLAEAATLRARLTEAGSKVEVGLWVDKRDRQTRKVRWEQLDEVLAYDACDLDRDVVATDQIRTVLETFRDKVFTEMFPGRTDLPKTLVFAKDDTHADDIVRICREVFGKGNDFCRKITSQSAHSEGVAWQKRY